MNWTYTLVMSKTEKDTPKVKRVPHPKKYTDPIENLKEFIEEELNSEHQAS